MSGGGTSSAAVSGMAMPSAGTSTDQSPAGLASDSAIADVPSGSNALAATVPADEAPRQWAPSGARRVSRRSATAVTLVGHVIFSLLGLAIGYYVLVWLNPHANFLNLNLPGLHQGPSDPRR